MATTATGLGTRLGTPPPHQQRPDGAGYRPWRRALTRATGVNSGLKAQATGLGTGLGTGATGVNSGLTAQATGLGTGLGAGTTGADSSLTAQATRLGTARATVRAA